jgi:hypothetical protein
MLASNGLAESRQWSSCAEYGGIRKKVSPNAICEDLAHTAKHHSRSRGRMNARMAKVRVVENSWSALDEYGDGTAVNEIDALELAESA